MDENHAAALKRFRNNSFGNRLSQNPRRWYIVFMRFSGAAGITVGIIRIIIGALLLIGVGTSADADGTPVAPERTRRVVAETPSADASLSLRLSLMPRHEPLGTALGPTFNVKTHLFNQSPWPLRIFPKYVFRARREGHEEILRILGIDGGDLHPAFGATEMNIALPAPAGPGRWILSVELSHSPVLLDRYREQHPGTDLPAAGTIPASDETTPTLWEGSLRSNELRVTFKELSPGERKTRDAMAEVFKIPRRERPGD